MKPIGFRWSINSAWAKLQKFSELNQLTFPLCFRVCACCWWQPEIRDQLTSWGKGRIYPVLDRFLCIPSGAWFLPSSVCIKAALGGGIISTQHTYQSIAFNRAFSWKDKEFRQPANCFRMYAARWELSWHCALLGAGATKILKLPFVFRLWCTKFPMFRKQQGKIMETNMKQIEAQIPRCSTKKHVLFSKLIQLFFSGNVTWCQSNLDQTWTFYIYALPEALVLND